MSYKISDLRNISLNMYNFIGSGLSADGYILLSGYGLPYVVSGIYFTRSYPDDYDDVKTPAIAIDFNNATFEALQLGPGREPNYRYNIDVFGRNDGERDDLGERVRNYFNNTMPIINFNEYFTNGTYSYLGLANFDNISMFTIHDDSYNATKHILRINVVCDFTIPTGHTLI